ncbi:hypothetical protein BG011_009066 [Mortierella polycephala]|uniref:C2H2-type domain-containing protein n=1 Tax=Mortierella polycephala TaxID=41804 RepID=A0A9P6TWZ9_9FUNG|nr:hypothetical protein BG011_009066 [Mortierella polycephala]
MSSTSSCSSSPFSSPETATELDILDMPMFFPSESSSIYQQILDVDGSNEVMVQQQPQFQSFASAQHQKHQQQFQYGMAQIGLGTPPTSPPTPSFHRYSGNAEVGTMYYPSQPLAIHNAYVSPTQPIAVLQQQQQQQLQQAEQHAYNVLLQQFDNLESSLISPSPTASSCSSSLNNSPYTESPLVAIGSDFDLFPLNNSSAQQTTAGYPSGPVMAPSTMTQSMYSQSSVYHQMTPPMHHVDLEREVSSLFKSDVISLGPNAEQQPITTEMSLLCKCPGQYPCGEQVVEPSLDSIPSSSSLLSEIREDEYSEEDSGSEEDQELDPSYMPLTFSRSSTANNMFARSNAGGARSRSDKARPKSMMISTSSQPYSSPYSRQSSPGSPTRQVRRRSSSGSYSSFTGNSHNQQLLDPQDLPEITNIHVCPVCSRHFSRPYNLRTHILTHTTSRPYACDQCSWAFSRKNDLVRHARAKHPDSAIAKSAAVPKKNLTNESCVV